MALNPISITITGNAKGIVTAFDDLKQSMKTLETGSQSLQASINSINSVNSQLLSSINSLNTSLTQTASASNTAASGVNNVRSSMNNASTSSKSFIDKLDQITRYAGFREMSNAIRNGIENPMLGARAAVEALLLSFGTAGLVATGVLALGAGALQAANYTGKLAEQAQIASVEFGVNTVEAQRLTSAFEIVGVKSEVATSGLKAVQSLLNSGTPASRELEQQLANLGVQFYDTSTKQALPAVEVFLQIIDKLGGMSNSAEKQRAASAALGGQWAQLLAVSDELPSAFNRVSIALESTEGVDKARKYAEQSHTIYQELLADLGKVGASIENVVGKISQLRTPSNIIPQEQKIGGLSGFANLVKAYDEGTLSAKDNATATIAVVTANQAVINAIRPIGGELATAEDKWRRYSEELSKVTQLPKEAIVPTGIYSGETVGQLTAQTNASRENVIAIRGRAAELRAEEIAVKSNEATGISYVNRQQVGYDALARTINEVGSLQISKAKELADQEFAIKQASIEKQKSILRVTTPTESDPGHKAALAALNAEEEAAKQTHINKLASLDGKYYEDQSKEQKDLLAVIEEGSVMAEEFIKKEVSDKIKAQQEYINYMRSRSTAEQEEVLRGQVAKQQAARTELEDAARVRDLELQSAGAGFKKREIAAEAYRQKILQATEALNQLLLEEAKQKDLLETQKEQEAFNKAQSEGLLPPGAQAPPPVTSAQSQAAGRGSENIAQVNKQFDELQAAIKKQRLDQIFNTTFGKINQQFSSLISGMIMGTERFGVAIKKMGAQLISDWASSLALMGLKWVEHQALLTAAKILGIGQQKAAQASGAAAGIAIDKTASEAMVLIAAGVAAANAYAATAIIPFVGPFIAPAAAASAFAGALAFGQFEKGGVVGGSEMMAKLHPHEMVLPAHLSQGIQSFISNNQNNSRSNSSSSALVYNNNSKGSQSGMSENDFVKTARKFMRDGKLSPSGAYAR